MTEIAEALTEMLASTSSQYQATYGLPLPVPTIKGKHDDGGEREDVYDDKVKYFPPIYALVVTYAEPKSAPI